MLKGMTMVPLLSMYGLSCWFILLKCPFLNYFYRHNFVSIIWETFTLVKKKKSFIMRSSEEDTLLGNQLLSFLTREGYFPANIDKHAIDWLLVKH